MDPAAKRAAIYEKKREAAMDLNRKASKKLCIVLMTSCVFICVEITGGYFANSIAIMSDAAHIASDVIGFGISICALKIAHRHANEQFTFGYHRAEIIGAFCSIFTIWILTVWLLFEATKRFFNPPEIGGTIMLATACASFFFNLIQIKILHSGEGGHVHAGGAPCSGHGGGGHDHAHGDDDGHDHAHDHGHDHGHGHDHAHERSASEVSAATVDANKKNLNVEAAFLHILGDLLNSIGVIIAATIVYIQPDYWYVDPICTYVFALIVLWTTRQTFWQCVVLILETTPHHLDISKIKERLGRVEGVGEVHDVHAWSLSNDKFSFTAHITLKEGHDNDQQRVLREVDNILRKKYELNHNCVQIETFAAHAHGKEFNCGNDIHA